MADTKKKPPGYTPYVPPPASGTHKKLTYKQLRALWIQAGGDPALASTMAAIAQAESNGGDPNAHNGNASTGDDSWGLWQINYYGKLGPARTKTLGPKEKMVDPLTNAKAAVRIFQSQGLAAWSTYTNGAYQAYYRPVTPDERAGSSAALLAAEAKSQAYIQANVSLATQKAQARAFAHESDPWVVVKYKNGQVVGFTEAYGAEPPKNVLTQGAGKNALPVTRSMLSQIWTSTYATIYDEYAGKTPGAQDIVNTLESGLSPYALANKLSQSPQFLKSPIYKRNAGGVQDYAQSVLGTPASPDFVRKALVNGWNQNEMHNELAKLPQYLQGPEYQTNLAQMKTVYQGIYGAPDATATQTLREVAANHWTPDQFASYLRDQPQYKTSLEYQSNTLGFLDALGLFTGSQATLTPGAAPTTGGTAVKNAPNVPGTPKPLNPSLPFTPTISGANGLG